MKALAIYTAASFRMLYAVKLFHMAVRERIPAVTILDWTAKATPPDGLTPAQRREWFDTEQNGGQVYAFCRDACVSADVVIYLGQAGQDAGVEIGMAAAAGVPVIGLRGPLEAPGLMLHGAVDVWCYSIEQVLQVLSRLAGQCGGVDCCDCEALPFCDRAER